MKSDLTKRLLPLAFLIAHCAQSLAQAPIVHRTALLIGNSQYHEAALPGAAASLKRVEQSLEAIGFETTRLENLSQKPLTESIDQWIGRIPTGSVAIIYYYGLGANVQRLGKWYNVLRPVGEQINNDNDYRSRGIRVGDLLTKLQERGGARLNMLLLDACWDSPIRPTKGTIHSGMKPLDVPAGFQIVFGASASTALPITSNPSPLATAVSKHAERFAESIGNATRWIATDASECWVGGQIDHGIGAAGTASLVQQLQSPPAAGARFVNSIGMSFRWCPPGNFQMGTSAADEESLSDAQPVKVRLTHGFWIGSFEVTQREYSVVARKNVPTGFTVHKNAPFWGISESKQVDDFCKKLAELESKAGTLPAGWEYATPTEAQWEYACRAGSRSAYHYGDAIERLGEHANFADRAIWESNPDYYWANRDTSDGVAEALAPVGQYRPNAWGIHDMHGNLSEVVADHYQPELPGGTDPLVRLAKNGVTVIRGGAWCSRDVYCQSAFRNQATGRDKQNYIGFRIVINPTP